MELVEDLLPDLQSRRSPQSLNLNGGSGNAVWISEHEKMLRKKMFVLLTLPKDEELEGK
jgi:hypothetical protein